MAELDKNGRTIKRSLGPFGCNSIVKNGEKYLTRIWLGRLRLHIFYKGDDDRDPHDHPWGFWTFPFHPYVEEVTVANSEGTYHTFLQVVPAWRWNWRPAEHCHRVIGPWDGRVKHHNIRYDMEFVGRDYSWLCDHEYYEPVAEPFNGRRMVTIVFRTDFTRMWGFLKNRDGKWCWQDFKTYLNGGGNAPCQ